MAMDEETRSGVQPVESRSAVGEKVADANAVKDGQERADGTFRIENNMSDAAVAGAFSVDQYSTGVDYSEKIAAAVANGDYDEASVLEQVRNAKIEDEGITKQDITHDQVSAYDRAQGMTGEELKGIADAKAAYQDAHVSGNVDGEIAAHAAAEEIRGKYGYSGGNQGDQFLSQDGYEDKKYEILTDDPDHQPKTLEDGTVVYPIRATRDIEIPDSTQPGGVRVIKAGEVGGYVENAGNLSQEGDCWIEGDSVVSGNAKICDNAQIRGAAEVSGDAVVHGYAVVSDDAQVSGRADVGDHAVVEDQTKIGDQARVAGDARIMESAAVGGKADISGQSYVGGSDGTYVGGNVVMKGSAQVFEGSVEGYETLDGTENGELAVQSDKPENVAKVSRTTDLKKVDSLAKEAQEMAGEHNLKPDPEPQTDNASGKTISERVKSGELSTPDVSGIQGTDREGPGMLIV